ncbi:uncharacterized protein RCC_09892 [Ramularia collo-cygni]|uniref:Uncharacterized protein n=1 Tax=Ramularia collo-cygni TaxID=112498 RepID=A0A2D3VED6_9PEZI|nr:uncharacterized protein RCC_09892 [Ramularia collo-cygni]CZT24175.1 uncharacterized protein RCC_09892 [Ramularia collo-cygni]
MPRKGKRKADTPTTPVGLPVSLTYTTSTGPFLNSLSAEIRNTIMALVCDETVTQYRRRRNFRRKKKGGDPPRDDGLPKPPPFLLVCKQMYCEAIQVFYARSIFYFQTQRSLNRWIATVNIEKLKLAQNVFVYSQGADSHVLLEALLKVKNEEKARNIFNTSWMKWIKWRWWSSRQLPDIPAS